jgi:hypothetical protein
MYLQRQLAIFRLTVVLAFRMRFSLGYIEIKTHSSILNYFFFDLGKRKIGIQYLTMDIDYG